MVFAMFVSLVSFFLRVRQILYFNDLRLICLSECQFYKKLTVHTVIGKKIC